MAPQSQWTSGKIWHLVLVCHLSVQQKLAILEDNLKNKKQPKKDAAIYILLKYKFRDRMQILDSYLEN